MCGRFVSSTPPDQLARHFNAEPVKPLRDRRVRDAFSANYHVAPTQSIFTVLEERGTRRLDKFRWGLVPSWAADIKFGNRMINARAETIADRKAFRRPFIENRCIIPADGFYEWKKLENRRKQPMYLSSADERPFALAGIWDVWEDKTLMEDNGGPRQIFSCAIITREPSEQVAEVHDRMPVILPNNSWDFWLDTSNRDVEALQSLLHLRPLESIRIRPVSLQVNNVRRNGPELINEADPSLN